MISSKQVIDTKIRNVPQDIIDKDSKHYVYIPSLAKVNEKITLISQSIHRMVFDIKMPDYQTMVKNFKIKHKCRLKLTISNQNEGAIVGSVLVKKNLDYCLAHYPLHQMMESVELSIGGKKISMRIEDYLNEVLYISDCRISNKKYKQYPSYLPRHGNNSDSNNTYNSSMNSFNDSSGD